MYLKHELDNSRFSRSQHVQKCPSETRGVWSVSNGGITLSIYTNLNSRYLCGSIDSPLRLLSAGCILIPIGLLLDRFWMAVAAVQLSLQARELTDDADKLSLVEVAVVANAYSHFNCSNLSL